MKFLIKFIFIAFMAASPAAASVIPPAGGCALTVRVAQVIAPDRIAFTVETTACPWLSPGARHESGSIGAEEEDTLRALTSGAALSGVAQQGTSRGPGGAVSWTMFRSGGLSFTF